MRKPAPPSLKVAFSYEQVTTTAQRGIESHMQAARRSSGAEALARREVAYGIYIGWRALVEAYVDQVTYHTDDQRLELLLVL